AVDFAARQNLVRAGAALGELPDDDALDEIGARFQTEDRIAQFDFARRFRIPIEDFRFHDVASADCSGAGAFSRFVTDAGIGISFGAARLAASRTITQPPLLPGTAPRIMMRPRSTSTFAIST